MKSYLRLYFVLIPVLMFFVGIVNWLIDPLWYGSGNRINKKNFAFNERVSKTNLFMQNSASEYDCYLFGNSKVTLIKASDFKSSKCFNYSFSLALVPEIVNYGKYVKQRGGDPKVIYIGFDGPLLGAEDQAEAPPIALKPIYQAYLFSLDVLGFSYRTLRDQSPLPRYYDEDFEVKVISNAPKYRPRFLETKSERTCNKSSLAHFKELRETFPNAKIIGYVPPLSPWLVVSEYYNRNMDCYLSFMKDTTAIFDVVYDFSIPSKVTEDVANTYDGIHYYPQVNEKITQFLQGAPLEFGIQVTPENFEAYQQAYQSATRGFLARQNTRAAQSLENR
ncbi:MAG TPA: hypothetical protein IGS53_15880 [Leptolyngbyaceae cyanobacterium M33_DOE_097]|uniref:Uncharacterized protein n=1 Tax=Oscillatoriales cyanobacterium SpSt-418 TaxID=2282169 RepID=A0A7C3PCG9_9CYAN|nr:hypothetical protein [Leptolyngbyaceae cyanobacterium M33_DOE_097]